MHECQALLFFPVGNVTSEILWANIENLMLSSKRQIRGESWSLLRTSETECKQSEESFLETLQDLTEPMPWGLLPIGLWIWEYLSKVKGYFNQILSDLVLGILSAQRKVWPCLVHRQSTSLYQNVQPPNEENICAIESVKSKRILGKNTCEIQWTLRKK